MSGNRQRGTTKIKVVTCAACIGLTAFLGASRVSANCGDGETFCWSGLSANHEDLAVGPGMFCAVGAHTTSIEDTVQCFRPSGANWVSQPYIPGWQDPAFKVPGGIASMGAISIGSVAIFGSFSTGADDIAVLSKTGIVYYAQGLHTDFYAGYEHWLIYRHPVNATTGASICLKGLFSWSVPNASGIALSAIGCNGELYSPGNPSSDPYNGWRGSSGPWSQGAGDLTYQYLLKSTNNLIQYSTFMQGGWFPALPTGAGVPKLLGGRYVIATQGTGSRLYKYSGAWSRREIGLPTITGGESYDTLYKIVDGQPFRGHEGDVFVISKGLHAAWYVVGFVR